MAEPKLRFMKTDGTKYPSLRNATMGDFYIERNERGNESLPVLTVSIHSGVSDGELDEDELGKRVKRSTDLTLYKKAEKGDLVFNMMRAWQGAVGSVKTTGMVSPAYIVAKPNSELDPSFMDYYVQSKSVIDRFNRLSYGALDFRKRLYWDSFVTTEVNIPTIEEQQKIADCMSSIDEVITASGEEVAILETQKKAVMKKVFSQEVCFYTKDDQEPIKNEKVRLSEICNIIKGKQLEKEDVIDGGKYYHLNGGASPSNRTNKWNTEANTISISEGGNSCGFVNWNTERFFSGGHNYTLRNVKDCLIPQYLFQFLKNKEKEIMGLRVGSGLPNIQGGDLGKVEVVIPCLEEQHLIADFLSDFDEAIAAAKKELELWKELKKGLLQQMFV